MNEYDTAELSQKKRQVFPNSFGKRCPACGEPFDAGSTGALIVDGEGRTTECMSWVRICTIPNPKDQWEWLPDELAMSGFAVVHKDEHL